MAAQAPALPCSALLCCPRPAPFSDPARPACGPAPPLALHPPSAELYKAGVVDEMVSDAMESVAGTDEEEESEELVDKVLLEVAGETMAQMAAAPQRKQAAKEEAAAAADDEEADALQARLAAVRS